MDKRDYTQASFYEVVYECFDEDGKRCMGPFTMGYFVSKDEAMKYLREEVMALTPYQLNEMSVVFNEVRHGIHYEHSYKISEKLCGRAMPDYLISRPVSLTD